LGVRRRWTMAAGVILFVLGVSSLFRSQRFRNITNRWIAGAIAVLGLVLIAAGARDDKAGDNTALDPAPTAVNAAGAAEETTSSPPLYEQLDREGMYHFVVIDAAQVSSERDLREIGKQICGSDERCAVGFWTSRKDAPRALPLTDAEVNSKFAQYNLNRSLGVDHVMCHPFGAPAERCTGVDDPLEEVVVPWHFSV
jgi:hypothetical protein